MTPHWVWVGILSLVSVFGAPALSTAQESADSGTPYRVWVEPGPSQPGDKASLDVTYKDEFIPGEEVVFDCGVKRYGSVGKLLVQLLIKDQEGKVLFEGETPINLFEGQESCEFRWNVGAVAPGVYKARFAWRDRPAFTLGWMEYVVRKVSIGHLETSLARVDQGIRSLEVHVDDLAAAGQRPPYIQMRLAVARDFVGLGRELLAQDEWRRTDRIVRYLQETEQSVRTRLTFEALTPELASPPPEVGLADLHVGDGTIQAGERPVFLCGWNVLRNEPGNIERLRRYGLNLAVITVSPQDTLLSETETADVAALLDPVFDQAEKCGISVTVNLAPGLLPTWALTKWSTLTNEALGGVDVTTPEARALTERHFRAVLPLLSGRKMLNSVCLLDRPRFRFEGDAVRERFLDLVKATYPDRHSLNQSWKSHLASFDDIDIGRDHQPYEYQEQHAFQYEWQTFHNSLGEEYVAWLISLARELAPETPVQIELENTIFQKGESRLGVDHENLVRLTDMSGCTTSIEPSDPWYAVAYPQQSLMYAFLHSMAPGKPVFDLDDEIFPSNDCAATYSGAFVHSALWEGAISGLSASALGGWDPDATLMTLKDKILVRPDCIEGYARACLDLNRLAELVVAFQRAPAEVVILWSLPAKILDDGDPYLESAADAYEGCSFGGRKVQFISPRECAEAGGLADVKVLVIPETPSLDDATYAAIQEYVASGGLVARLGTPIPYNERGFSRHDSIGATNRTILVRGQNLPTEYLHAMDAVQQFDVLETIPRTVNPFGYPLEGVRTQYIEKDGVGYLYVLNLRKDAVLCHLVGLRQTGRDLIEGRDVVFPAQIEPLDPMLIRLNPAPEGESEETEKPVEEPLSQTPVVELEPAPSIDK